MFVEAQVPDRGHKFRDDLEQALRPLREAVSRGNFDSVGNLVEVTDDECKLAISMNVAQFTPEQLSVDVDGRVLTIEGKQENEESNGSFMRSFMRQWTLPDDVDADQLKCSINEDGHLAVEAPKIAAEPIRKAHRQDLDRLKSKANALFLSLYVTLFNFFGFGLFRRLSVIRQCIFMKNWQ